MSLQRIAQKRDENEPGIVAGLEDWGCTVDRLPGGDGRPDLLVAEPVSRENILMEVKMDGKVLNPKQKTYHARWKGRIHVVFNLEQALAVVRWYSAGKKV